VPAFYFRVLAASLESVCPLQIPHNTWINAAAARVLIDAVQLAHDLF
jgi:hypothetical protein